MNAAKLPAAYLQRFGTKIPLSSGQKLKQLLSSEAEKGVCALEEREAGMPPTPVLFVRLLGSRSGLKEGEFTGVSGYLFTCTTETENTCLSQNVLMASAKVLPDFCCPFAETKSQIYGHCRSCVACEEMLVPRQSFFSATTTRALSMDPGSH